ncbi:MAG: InlB B-repeat-containing protein [Bacteroidales bacterium]|nr:InlB B-repeat-containing protein [Bacteroidales bacterium]
MKKVLFFLTLFLLTAGMSYAQNVAKIGATEYPTLQEAIDYANANLTGDVTIELIKDDAEWVLIVQKAGLNLTINGNNYTLTGQIIIDGEERSAGTETLTIENLNFAYNASNFAQFTNSANLTNAFIVTPRCGNNAPADAPYKTTRNYNYAHNVTVSNCNFDGDGSNNSIYGVDCAWGGNPINITVQNCTAKNVLSLARFCSTTTFVLDGCTATENVSEGIFVSGGKGSFTITDNEIKAPNGYALFLQNAVNSPAIDISGNTMTADTAILLNLNDNGAGGLVASTSDVNITSGTYIGEVIDNDNTVHGQETHLNISGGDYSNDMSGEPCAPGYAAFDNQNGTWTVTKAYSLYYDKNEASATGTMDTLYVKQSGTDAERTLTVANCDFTNDGYAFVRWNTKADGTGENLNPGAELTLTQDTTLYALWGRVLNATNGNIYSDLQAAINAATAGDSLVILTDLNLTATISIDKSLTINGNKKIIKTTSNRGMWFDASGVTLNLKNFYLDGTNMTESDGIRGIQVDQNDVTLIMDSCRLYNMVEYPLYTFVNVENADVTVTNSYIKGGLCALRSYASNSNFIFVNDTLYGVNHCSPGNHFPTIYLEGNQTTTLAQNNTISIEKCVVINEGETGCAPKWLGIALGAANNHVTVDADTKIIDSEENDIIQTLNMWYGGNKNYVTIPLTSEQIAAVEYNNYTVTTSGNSSVISAPVCWKGPGVVAAVGVDSMFLDFHTPFLEDLLVPGDVLTLDDNITLKDDANLTITGDLKLNFSDGTNTYTITQGDYSIVLDDGATCTTDKQVTGLFTALSGSSIIETDNGDNTYTYSVAPYYTITYYSNNSAADVDVQARPYGETVNLYDYTTFNHADSTIYRWNTQADGLGTDYAFDAPYNDDDDLDLYAVWRLNLNMTMDSTDVVCHSENNGTDTVKIIGGEAPYKLLLSGGALTDNVEVTTDQTTYIFTDMKPSINAYKVRLTDVLTKDTIYGTFTISEPDTLVITKLTIPEGNQCPLMGTGHFDVSVTAQGGNLGEYHYTWSGDATPVDANATEVPALTDDRDYKYVVDVTVTDNKACTATATDTIRIAPVIADDGTVHANSKLTANPDTIKVGIYQGCDTIIRDFGTYVFTSTNPAITEDILDTVYNDVSVNYPDSIFPVGYSTITWTATDTCGYSITGEQVVYIYHFPCPSVELDGHTYGSVRLGCVCWLNENLRAEKYSDGRDIPNVMSYYSQDYPNTEENVNNFGHLYDWYAAADTFKNSIATIEAKYAEGKRIQGVCPEGWYLPNDEDFETLYSLDAATLRSPEYWLEGGNNSTGFNAVPGGMYNCSTNRFENLKGESYYWSCHPVYDKATGAQIDYVCERLLKVAEVDRCFGFSVRCVLITDEQ